MIRVLYYHLLKSSTSRQAEASPLADGKTILISTFQLKCVILTSLPPNSVSIEQMEERPAGHIMLLSSRLLNTDGWNQH